MEAEESADTELEERGGLQKLKLSKEERFEKARLDRGNYKAWFQVPCWFDEEEDGGRASQAAAPKGAGYANLKEWMGSQEGKELLLNPHMDGSDFERLKHRADHCYFVGDYEGCAAMYLRLLGTYRLLVSKTGGGIGYEIQDAVARCLIKLDRATSVDATTVLDDLRQSSKTKRLGFALLSGKMHKVAARNAEALKSFQEAASVHPADPMVWVYVAEAYRADGEDDARAALLARRCIRMAFKMIQFCSNAVQCTLSIKHFAKTTAYILELCQQHSAFYMGPGVTLCEETHDLCNKLMKVDLSAHFLKSTIEKEELEVMCQGASDFEQQWLCSDGADKAQKMLDSVKEDSIREASG